MKKLKEKIDELIKIIEIIKNRLNNIIDNFEVYYKINNDIINCYENKYKNYQTLKNIQNINEYNKTVIGDINDIIYEKDFGIKLKYIQ